LLRSPLLAYDCDRHRGAPSEQHRSDEVAGRLALERGFGLVNLRRVAGLGSLERPGCSHDVLLELGGELVARIGAVVGRDGVADIRLVGEQESRARRPSLLGRVPARRARASPKGGTSSAVPLPIPCAPPASSSDVALKLVVIDEICVRA
jgi:hypothetical protein